MADKYGNAYIYGPRRNDLAVAAARKLIITAGRDEIL